MSNIFISYSTANKNFALRLTSDLENFGHQVWLDERKINIGDSLIEKIREGIDTVDFVLAILSKTSVKSEWVKKELEIASNREIDEKRIIVLPILIEDVILPGFLKGKLYADFTNQRQYKQKFELLLKAVSKESELKNGTQFRTVSLEKLNIYNLKRILKKHLPARNKMCGGDIGTEDYKWLLQILYDLGIQKCWDVESLIERHLHQALIDDKIIANEIILNYKKGKGLKAKTFDYMAITSFELKRMEKGYFFSHCKLIEHILFLHFGENWRALIKHSYIEFRILEIS